MEFIFAPPWMRTSATCLCPTKRIKNDVYELNREKVQVIGIRFNIYKILNSRMITENPVDNWQVNNKNNI